MLVREKEKKRRDSAEMESMVMDMELVEEDRKSDRSKFPLGNNEWDLIKQGTYHQANDHITWDQCQVQNGENKLVWTC